MAIYLKSQADIDALISGSMYASIDTPTKTKLAQHFELMPQDAWQPALDILVATLPSTQAAFCQELFQPTPPPSGSATNTPSVSGDFVADIPALRALDTVDLPLGDVRGATKSGGTMGLWRLRIGTDADDAPSILQPHDYDAVANPRVWEEQL